jgi:hypothetical protein
VGKRSRKRGGSGAAESSSTRAERDAARSRRAEAAAAGGGATSSGPGPGASRRRRSGAERPAPPWGSFPLTELVVLLGLLLAVGGFLVGVEDGRGRTMFGAGVVLGALGGLEIVVRDHFAGYRSHTTLISGVAAFVVITAVVLVLREVAPTLPPYAALSAALVAGGVVFGLAFRQLRRTFQTRSGGLSYR